MSSLVDDIEDLDEARAAYRSVERASLDWPELRRAILDQGGIGPSRDWTPDAWPGDLYRVHGKAPDLVATETMLGTADLPPWTDDAEGRPSDSDMYRYLQRAWKSWQSFKAATPRRAPKVAPAPVTLPPGRRSFAELVRDLRARHGADVDLSGLRSEYVSAYESGERVTVERDGRTYRGTIGATRGARPRFVLLLSLDL